MSLPLNTYVDRPGDGSEGRLTSNMWKEESYASGAEEDRKESTVENSLLFNLYTVNNLDDSTLGMK